MRLSSELCNDKHVDIHLSQLWQASLQKIIAYTEHSMDLLHVSPQKSRAALCFF